MTPPATGRPVVWGTQGIVAGGHYLTAMSGMRMLLSGGNAFDAAVAAGFTAAVVEPSAPFSLASEGAFTLYDAASGRVRALSGQGVAPKRATIDAFRQRGLDKVPVGPGPNSELSFAVPGIMDALLLMLETYGTKTLGEVLAPAIDYAHRGFPMYEYLRESFLAPNRPWCNTMEQFRHYAPAALEVFYPGGEPHEVGQLVVQKQLAATLEKLVQAETRGNGHRMAGLRAAREEFYSGDIARAMVACSDRVGGLLSMEDLASYSASFEEPLKTSYMGYEVYTQSTWTQGAVVLQTLNILEHFDLRGMGHNSTQYIHTVAEALKLAFADREAHYGDPDYVRVPIEGLLSKEYAAARAGLIQADRASPGLPPPGDPWRYCLGPSPARPAELAYPAPTQADGAGEADGDTTYLATMDRDGNVVCATPSGGFFPKTVFIPELGCAFSTRCEVFFLDEEHPNALRPGKRPRTTLVNYIVCKDGTPVLTAGCPGGDRQAQADLQVILNMLLFGMEPQEAVEVPRFITLSIIGSFYPHTYLPGQLNLEPATPQQVRDQLSALGHRVVVYGSELSSSAGLGAIVIRRDPRSGTVSAGTDPRRITYAAAW